MGGRRIATLWMIAMVVITYGYIRQNGDMPPPSTYVSSSILYGIAGIVHEFAPPLGGLVALGWTIALSYRWVAVPVRMDSRHGPTGGRRGGKPRREVSTVRSERKAKA